MWIRIDRRTRATAAFQLPPRFRPLAFSAKFVYGVWRDGDDVEHVQVYAMDER